MTNETTAAVLSGAFSTVVAVVGIVGAVVAQTVAARRAHANALAMFELERGERAVARRAEMRREDDFRFAADRRATYAAFLRRAADLADAYDVLRAATKDLERRTRGLVDVSTAPVPVLEAVRSAEDEVVATRRRCAASTEALAAALEEVDLISSPAVRTAARRLLEDAGDPARTRAARSAFLSAARAELGFADA